jgi:acid phosphatase (class B)
MNQHRLLVCLVVTALAIIGCSSGPADVPTGAVRQPSAAGADIPLAVGFDFDDTLVFSSAAFDRASQSGVARDSVAFWELVNSLDHELSTVKQRSLSILRSHQARGERIYVITARHPHGVDGVVEFIHREFGIPKENVFFETEGKTDRIRELGLAVFYGDSDGDIRAAQEAGARAVRILRSPNSSYRWSYNPGKFGEEIIHGSED